MVDDYYSLGISLDKVTHKDVIEKIYEILQKNFRTTRDYTKSPVKRFKGNIVNKSLRNNVEYCAYSFYCYILARYLLFNDDIKLDKDTIDELKYYEYEKGGSCFYNATLFLNMLMESGLVDKKNVKIVQGYYRHNLRSDFPKLIPMGKTHYGTHAWSLINKSVVDFCIVPQEGNFFDFGDLAYIKGVVPDGMDYFGYEEDYNIIRAYGNDIANHTNRNFREWTLSHQKRALEIYKENILDK